MIAYVCTGLVGGALLFSAFVKAIDGRTFIRDLTRYGLLPGPYLVLAAAVLAGTEAALGTALIAHLVPSWTVPGAMGVVGGLAGLTLWGEYARDLDDCGCYGGVVLLTPKQSVLLDAGYVLLLSGALLRPAGGTWMPNSWGLGAVCLAFVGATGATWWSRAEPLVDLARLRSERRWKRRWLPNHPEVRDAPHFLVFLSADCPYCKRWVPLLNVMNAQSDFPNVLGLMSPSAGEMDDFRREHLIRFPIGQMDRLLFQRMVNAYPTAVLVKDGEVVEKWTGEFPEPYFSRIQEFYEGVEATSQTGAEEAGFRG